MDHVTKTLSIQYVSADKLEPSAYNPRKWDEVAITN